MLAAQALELAHPLGGGDVEAALALHHLDDHRGRLVDAAARIVEQLVDHRDGVDLVAEVVGVGHATDVAQPGAGTTAVMLVAGGGQGADAAAVEAVGEADHVAAPGDLARQLQRGFHRVGAGRPGELHQVVGHAARLEDQPVEGLEEGFLGRRVHVQAMGQAVALDVVEQRLLEQRMVVAVVERTGAGEEVDVALAVAGDQFGAARLLEYHRERAAVAAHGRFMLFKGVHAVSLSCSSSSGAANGPAR
ncbi:hypothetical protein D3C75_904620 [compost metagenome]